MTQWSMWGGFMKKTRGQKSRATVPLRSHKCVFILGTVRTAVNKNKTDHT